MRRVEHLIRAIRRHTDNETNGSDSGLSDEEYIQFLNDAQDHLYREINKTYRKIFTTSSKFPSVANQEEYDTPIDMFQTSIVSLEYSPTGQEKDYYPLQRRELIEQVSAPGVPLAYGVRGQKIVVNCIPQSAITNAFRIKYNKALPRLDKRRTVVKSATAVGTVTALTLEPTNAAFNYLNYLENDYLTTVDFDGTIKCTAIGYGSVAVGTGVVTLQGTKTLLTGETVVAGQYVCLGKRATTHSQLLDDCEGFLIAWGVWKGLKRDSSSDSVLQNQELAVMQQSIIDSYGENYQDVDQIPIINSDYAEYL